MAEERVIKIGMLGLGTVGTGVYKVLKSQQEEMLPKLGARVELKKILVRNVEKAAAKVDDPSIITTNFEDIANDPEIEIVVEVMGGKQRRLWARGCALRMGRVRHRFLHRCWRPTAWR